MNSSNQHKIKSSATISPKAVIKQQTSFFQRMPLRMYVSVIFIFALLVAGCKKFVTVDPPNSGLVSQTVYASNTTASAAVTSIYSRISQGGFATGNTSISLYTGLASDELTDYSGTVILSQLYTNRLVATSALPFWTPFYQYLYNTNAALDGLQKSNGLSDAMRNQLIGEVRFLRAFLLYYTTSLYGDIPMVTTPDFRINSSIGETTVDKVYAQCIEDLVAAKDLLSDKYLTATGSTTPDRVRPNKMAALALLARLYLHTMQWAQAEAATTEILSKTTDYNLVTDLTKVFLSGSKEAIWQLQPVLPGFNTLDAFYYVLTSTPGTDRFLVSLSTGLVNTFDPSDVRLAKWIGSYKNTTTNVTYYYPYKYKVNLYNATAPVTEPLMVLRVAEQFLIRAEARAYQSNWSGAASDLNAIRTRAGLGNLTPTTLPTALTAINRERQLELFTEWGHRWFDLKRTGMIDAVMDTVSIKKGSKWRTTDKLFPIPPGETIVNPNLTQNDGY